MLKNLIFLFVFSTFVTIVWIGTTLYHNSTESKISESNLKKIEPINSVFDLETLEKLDTRQEIPVDLSEQLNIIGEDEATSSSQLEEPAPLPQTNETVEEEIIQ